MRSTLALLIFAAGCSVSFPLPMTAAQLAVYDSGPALVAYLAQPDASPTVCDARAQGPHVNIDDGAIRQSLVDALVGGKLQPEVWRRCANAILRSAQPTDERAWVDTVGRSYRKVMKTKEFEKLPALQDRLSAMQKFYIDRRHGLNGNETVDDPLIADLRRALLHKKLGPIATQLGDELIDVVDIEHGVWQGHPVDVPMMDTLFAAKDEKTLERFANRLTDDALRADAKRRVIRLHIAASPYDEVRAHAADVEAIVMKEGVNPIDLSTHPATSASFDMTKAPMRGVLVRQDVLAQQATLLGYSGDRPGVSVLPEMNLRNALLVSVTGYVRAVTLCGHPKSLDPSPCVPVAQVRIDNPDAYIDKGGAFHFTEHIAMSDAVNLAQQKDRFVLPVAIAGKPMAELDWRLYYEKPADVVLSGNIAGAAGPNLAVVADRRDPGRYIFTIRGWKEPLLAVVEAGDAPSFYIVSRGAQGFSGSDGSPGGSGSDGGECGSGGDGGPGGDGSDGGPGGPGGDIELDVSCGGAACTDALHLVQRQVVSQGGAGGPGGSGGSGGSGGAGGSGRAPTTHVDSDGNTVVDDPGCSGGPSGSNGSDGANGNDGPPGAPGWVRASVVD